MSRTRKRAPTIGIDGGHGGPPAAGWLVIGPGTPEERRVEIGDRPLCLGSDEEADILLEDPHVSRRHCEIRLTAEGVLLRDLGSKNGTYLGGTAVQSVLLRSGALITLGRTLVRFETEGSRSPSSPPSAAGDEATRASVSPRRLRARRATTCLRRRRTSATRWAARRRCAGCSRSSTASRRAS